jgi:hypothetical protein
MGFGTRQYLGELGKHRNPEGQDCTGRLFEVRTVGSGAVYTDEVECMTCHKHFQATDQLVVDVRKSAP